jgi:hypothetical protein
MVNKKYLKSFQDIIKYMKTNGFLAILGIISDQGDVLK